ncbi:MAG: hypothetical protein HQM09_04855 [Candidatus Riflebacteria bacterium]|nr:hypothetical protein [Candidatus Riflebacteria bacterium]
MDFKKCFRWHTLFFLLLIWIWTPALPTQAAASDTFDPGGYVLKIYQRVIALGASILEEERETIFRLKQGRPVDNERIISRYRSARNQIRTLRKIAISFEKRLSGSDPRIPKIQSLKLKIPYIIDGHKKNIAELNTLSGGKLGETTQFLENACGNLDDSTPVASYPIRSTTDGF